MAQKKLLRFNEIKNFSNVLEYPENMKGKWNLFFKNHNPVILELACGKGEYTIGMSQLYPEKNFIGVDIKGNRLWAGAKTAMVNKMPNVAFLRTQIDKIDQYFNADEVNEIWITFPDPHLRKSKARKRLTHPKFLRLYKKFLHPSGFIHLKTDSPDLYAFTKTVIKLYHINIIFDFNDLYKIENINDELKIKTHYESLDIAKSNTVFYLCFQLPEEMNNNDDKLKEQLIYESII
ncbi:MAG: tRNA (guanosine(46)-N7)-methyltransferase TrmB [Bacteroidota bacterium]|nr:tRNA (guanosine(46)-N7)-methyltransferase TrmB [Bacteroidota bacterium]